MREGRCWRRSEGRDGSLLRERFNVWRDGIWHGLVREMRLFVERERDLRFGYSEKIWRFRSCRVGSEVISMCVLFLLAWESCSIL